MKEKMRNTFEESQRDYLCPVCQKSFHLEAGSLRCGSGHCFDISAKGYINFTPNVKSEKYSRALFESRQAVFADGFYEPAAAAVSAQVLKHAAALAEKRITERLAAEKAVTAPQTATTSELTGAKADGAAPGQAPFVVMDAGCGEGYYALYLERQGLLPDRSKIFAIDIVKDAILLAAKRDSNVNWIVADLTQIPIKRNKVDVLLNILTPANYSEFNRVLKDEGLFIKVIPAAYYLKEVRQAAAGQLSSKTYSNQDVADYFCQHMELVERKEILYTRPVTRMQFDHFLRMTPMTFGVDVSRLVTEYPQQITIHLELLVGRKKPEQLNPRINGSSAAPGGKSEKQRKRRRKDEKKPSGSNTGTADKKKKKRAKK